MTRLVETQGCFVTVNRILQADLNVQSYQSQSIPGVGKRLGGARTGVREVVNLAEHSVEIARLLLEVVLITLNVWIGQVRDPALQRLSSLATWRGRVRTAPAVGMAATGAARSVADGIAVGYFPVEHLR